MRYSVVVAVAMVVAAPTFVAAVPGIAKKLAMKGVDKFHKHKFTMHDLKTAADVSQTAAQVSNNVKTINDNLGRREAHLLGRDDVEMELHDQAKRELVDLLVRAIQGHAGSGERSRYSRYHDDQNQQRREYIYERSFLDEMD